MKRDEKTYQEAKDVAKLQGKGREIADKAFNDAVISMRKIVDKTRSKEARVEALRAHALYMGIGVEFMGEIVPRLNSFLDGAIEIASDELDKNEARILSSIFVAKVLKNINDAVTKLDNE